MPYFSFVLYVHLIALTLAYYSVTIVMNNVQVSLFLEAVNIKQKYYS